MERVGRRPRVAPLVPLSPDDVPPAPLALVVAVGDVVGAVLGKITIYITAISAPFGKGKRETLAGNGVTGN